MEVRLMYTNDREALYSFELVNREYFESIGLGRGEEYYQRTNFQNSFQELLEEQKLGTCYMHLIFSSDNELVGRINLVDIVRGPLHKAELGYRVGKSYQGKGYATRAVDMVL